ncbi:hypothetical protein [Agrobacterium salinitolerans]|uniref:hypothetical protein n=1 Tax=Agrobacterium salinitolerans TaxID=1183413 RepID=UPI00157491B3|nr:hypothetical protein [Agrobacterium salinitolerans]NTA37536.1 hypothetical protein [Agrobacterium salinitolerans]
MSLAYFSRNADLAQRARERIRRDGYVAGQKLWTDGEREKIKQLAPDYRALRKVLRGRTATAIRFQCSRMGLTKSIHVWTCAELSKLRKMYSTASAEEICGVFSHSSWINIQQVARYHGLRRRRLGYKPTGIPGLDEVRRRCFEIGWTMPDLDSAARTGTYFSRAGWIGKKINHRALGRAIEALDGAVMPEWARYD